MKLMGQWVSLEFAAMGHAKFLAIIVLCAVACGCSTNARTGSIGSAGLRVEHRAEALGGHKTALTVIATTGALDSGADIDREAQAYADRYAKQACPRGHEFYTDSPIAKRGNERTFVFGCS